MVGGSVDGSVGGDSEDVGGETLVLDAGGEVLLVLLGAVSADEFSLG